jgi:hypothetical protein
MDFNLKFQLNSACSTEDVSEKSDSENTKDVGIITQIHIRFHRYGVINILT